MSCGPGTVQVKFDIKNPLSIAWAEDYSAQLVTNITAESRAAIRSVISRALSEGIAPRNAARLIRDVVGLNESQAGAVVNSYQTMKASGMSAEQIDKKITRYAEKLRKQRALTIARTETMKASNEGQRQLWSQAQKKNLLPANVQRQWIATNDEITCPICGTLNGKHAPLKGPFPGPKGIEAPPAHPNCRCTTTLYFGSNTGTRRTHEAHA